ncbi:DODA-type extradiol aromatic ring-opening family dioxygenase [Propionivibrio limicola]|uniref:DODA-type extradiol aromatic ring-opening family dioxygenase n=1 Tax=Propionivibrio limicola TaxID=167645 RepID=UPI00129237E4|nr:class III extradiol ring-cleavage dioxygenase [Propionivibrio limicola]
MSASLQKQPILFLSHGSPMTALGGDELNETWARLAGRLARPTAILVVSAHWTTRLPIVTGSAKPETIHDFGGFPAELYALQYPAPGDPALAQRIKQRLTEAGIATGIDAQRGLDHGAWVPLRSLFPAADIPVLQLSVQPERCARHHYAVGAALASFASENILIVATGHLTHNLMDYMRGLGQPSTASRAFRDWVHARLMRNEAESLFDWEQEAPGAKAAHPTPEHFLPLFVALGAAGAEHATEWLGGGWVGETLAADNYLFIPRGV